jgi:hypothetical protein
MNIDKHRYDCVTVGSQSAACLLLGPGERDEPLIGPADAIGRGVPIVERGS